MVPGTPFKSHLGLLLLVTTAAQQAVAADGRASLLPATSFLSPVVKYHGLARRRLMRFGFLVRPQLNSGTLGGRVMLLWETIKAEFAWEGSWRDICVPDVDLDGWQAAVRALEASGRAGTLSFGENAPPTSVDVLRLFASQDRATALWSIEVEGVVLACHFFAQTEIEFDLDPREVTGQPKLDALLEFMKTLSSATGRFALMTPENMHSVPFLRVSPTGSVEYINSGGFFEELAGGQRK